jgi:hypothetical protein
MTIPYEITNVFARHLVHEQMPGLGILQQLLPSDKICELMIIADQTAIQNSRVVPAYSAGLALRLCW